MRECWNKDARGNYKYTIEQISHVVRLADLGYTYKEIEEITGVKASSISRIKKKYANINMF